MFYSDRQDSRSHSSRRSSPESDRQGHSRSGSFDSRERGQDRDRHEHDRERDRERRDGRQRDWDRDANKDWLRSRDRDRIRERDRQREKRRDLDREKERPLPESTERERGLNVPSQTEGSKHSEMKPVKEHLEFEGICLDSTPLEKERPDKDLGSLQGFEDGIEAEKAENVEGWKNTQFNFCCLPEKYM